MFVPFLMTKGGNLSGLCIKRTNRPGAGDGLADLFAAV